LRHAEKRKQPEVARQFQLGVCSRIDIYGHAKNEERQPINKKVKTIFPPVALLSERLPRRILLFGSRLPCGKSSQDIAEYESAK
jgi:hypothetical protein